MFLCMLFIISSFILDDRLEFCLFLQIDNPDLFIE